MEQRLESFYACPKKEARLKEAIKRKFIIKTKDPDGIIRYTLTRRGMMQWLMERFRWR